jgi:hypothetical protein
LYYLGLPYRFAIPLLVISVVLHWLTSQSLFLAKITRTDSHRLGQTDFVTTCGYSCIAMIFALIVGAMAVLYLLGASAWPLRSHMPIVGASSAAIGASCHVRKTVVDVVVEVVGWGVEEEETSDTILDEELRVADSENDEAGKTKEEGQVVSEVGHLCLTSGKVGIPVAGKLYK